MLKSKNHVGKKLHFYFGTFQHFNVDIYKYVNLLDKVQIIARKYDIYFLFSSSLDGYVCCCEELCSGISIFGYVDFQMPEFENMCEFIMSNYPYEKDFSEVQIKKILSRIIQKIGQQEYLYSIEESVICKLINESLLLFDKFTYEGKKSELAFLKS